MIEITSSSIYCNDRSFTPYNVCMFEEKDNNVFYLSKDEPKSWICFDFKDHKIIPTNYMIKTASYGKNSHHPKNWTLEVSNDRIIWVPFDEQKNCPHVNGNYLVHAFDIQTQIKDPFRYIRIRQTGPNWCNCYYFHFSCIEFYGQLI